MKRRTFLASLATGAALGAAHKLCGSDDDLTVSLPKQPAKTSAKPDVDFRALLWSIAERETGNRDDVVGTCGSRSKYQISPLVWEQHVGPFSQYARIWGPVGPFETHCKGVVADGVAVKHLAWLKRNLGTPSPFWLAMAWHIGLTATQQQMFSAKVHTAGYKYAHAVTALYDDRLRST